MIGTPQHLREIMVALKKRAQSLVPQIQEGLTVTDIAVPTKDDASMELRIYTPTTHSNSFPGLY